MFHIVAACEEELWIWTEVVIVRIVFLQIICYLSTSRLMLQINELEARSSCGLALRFDTPEEHTLKTDDGISPFAL